MKHFISRMASLFNISPTGTRVAVILYSNQAKTEIDFGSYSNHASFRKAVLRLPHQKGLTRIDRALRVAFDDLYGPTGSSRRGVQKIAVVITDGKQTQAVDAVPLDQVRK
jgi:Mg-chelatase subunit ChlD